MAVPIRTDVLLLSSLGRFPPRAANAKQYRGAALDAQPVEVAPAPPAQPPLVLSPPRLPAVALGPTTAREAELCKQAGELSWAYLGTLVAADAGAIVLDDAALQQSSATAVRLVGPSLIGLTWGWTVGGTYLALPHCSPGYASTRPAEGSVRAEWPLALALGILATSTAPVVVGVETGQGTGTLAWPAAERVMRLVLAGAMGAVGSVMPYILPPSSWRAYRKLSRLQLGGDVHGAAVSYAFTF